MKLIIQVLIVLLGAVMVSAQKGTRGNNGSASPPVLDPSQMAEVERLLWADPPKPGRALSKHYTVAPTPAPTPPPANFFISGTYGERRRCFDKRFTMVCSWEAEKKQSKKYKKSHRRLGMGETSNAIMDFEDEDEYEQYEHIVTPDGRRLKIELDNVECVLGVGKKDSADSDDEYMEYKERIGFPSDRWTIKIGEQNDSGTSAPAFINYSFDTRITFEDIEDPNNSGDEITISGTIFIRMACFINPATGEDLNLFFRSHDVRITC